MGLLRFLLAVSVILGHTGSVFGVSFVGGPLAVEAFYIISGFYITLILNEKYVKANGSYWLFISNRFLRLYPVYWIVLLLTLICAYFIPAFNSLETMGDLTMYKAYSNDLGFFSYLFLIFNHIFIFFQDAVLFLGINLKTGNLFFTQNFSLTNPPLYRFELVPQAWSIGLELMFYLIAPFILRKKYVLIAIILISSLCLKIYAGNHGFNYDPWSYRFFPFEICYFLMGAVGYFLYKSFYSKWDIPNYYHIILYVILITVTVFYAQIHYKYISVIYIFMMFLAVPFLFMYTKNFKFDRLIGELSYPIYITHVLILNFFKAMGIYKHLNIYTIVCSTVVSIIISKFIGEAIEKYRQARVKNNKTPEALSGMASS